MLHFKSIESDTHQLLKLICSIKELSDFALAGGTDLALQIGHRISVDLDFFGNRPFATDEILDLLSEIRPLSIISQSKNILILNIQGVKVDFVNYRYPLISALLIEDNFRLLGLPDIAAMKLAAIAGRGRKRDFYDVHYLLKYFSLRQMIDFYNQKYDDGSEMMVARSLTFFDDADTDEPPRLFEEVSWDEVKKYILEQTRRLY